METERIYLEIFDMHYTRAISAMNRKKYATAKRETLLAAKALYQLARESTGEKRTQYLNQAEQLFEKAGELEKLELKEVKIEKNLSKGKMPEEHIAGESKLADDEEEGHFKPVDVTDVSFKDVIGLEDVKEAVSEKIIKPRQNPQLYKKFKMKLGGGILMYGPPGTGKTMIAKAIAHEVEARFYPVKCSDLVSKFFGNTEKNIQRLFETVRKEQNAVIFFDEFEGLASSRDKTNSSVMQRVIPEFLTQIQGINQNKQGNALLLLAATNKPWMLDSAFLRPGRFDERIYVGLPDDMARAGIFRSAIEKVPHEGDIDYVKLADMTLGFNCSDITYFIEKAKGLVIKREESYESGREVLTMADFERVLSNGFKTSVSKEDIKKLMAWREMNC